MNYVVVGLNPLLSLKTSDMAPVLSKEFLDIQGTIECRYTLKRVHGIIIAYSELHGRNKYSHHSSVIWAAWLNCTVFVYKLSGCGFQSCCCH